MTAKAYTRAEFVQRAKALIDELERDHEEHTGIPESFVMPFNLWVGELQALHDNTAYYKIDASLLEPTHQRRTPPAPKDNPYFHKPSRHHKP